MASPIKKFKCLIVEDNRKASELLKNKLKKYCPTISQIDQAFLLDEAIQILNHKEYHVLFLDIGMPTGTGFDLINYIEENQKLKMPEVIFTTGQNQKDYLLRAIRVSAADYLFKPVSNDELIRAVYKATSNVEQEQKVIRSMELLSTIPPKQQQVLNQIPVLLIKGIIEYVETSQIKYLEADGSMTIICRTDAKELHSVRHLGYYKKHMNAHPSFFQISAAYLVNLSLIRRYEHGRLMVTFKDGETIHASKRGGKSLRDFLRS